MKKIAKNWIYPLAVMGVFLMIISGCEKTDDNNKDDNNNPTPLSTVTDIDGNVYHTVTIGTQVWMAENLKTTKYNDGTAIPLVTDRFAWIALTTPKYCWYQNDSANYKNTYGALYNWYVVNTGKLAPAGWHVPTDAEWTILTNYLGGSSVAGGRMKTPGTKEVGSGLWYSPNTGATNESGFTAVPSGSRLGHGVFYSLGSNGYWWSSSENNGIEAWERHLSFDNCNISSYNNYKYCGLSVRCLKN